jgi:two-component system LytT family response regulator
MKQRTIIIDDEKYARENLIHELEKYNDIIEIIGEANNVESAIEIIDNLKPNLIFLDINLGDGTGFNVLENVVFNDFKIVFVTAYDQYAIKALKINAIDYLLKPLNKTELKEVVDKIVSLETKMQIQVQEILSQVKNNFKSKKIAIPSTEGLILYEIDSIIRCQSDGNYTMIFFNDKKKIISSKTLKHFDELLSEYGFERIHNSHLINVNYITKYLNKDGGFLMLSDGYEVPISQRKKTYVMSILEKIK